MNLMFWKKPATEPAPSGECKHLWSNWSEPEECEVRSWSFGYGSTPTERVGLKQDRHCLHCNLHQRTLS